MNRSVAVKIGQVKSIGLAQKSQFYQTIRPNEKEQIQRNADS